MVEGYWSRTNAATEGIPSMGFETEGAPVTRTANSIQYPGWATLAVAGGVHVNASAPAQTSRPTPDQEWPLQRTFPPRPAPLVIALQQEGGGGGRGWT